jgi:predicted Zn finger-like uncharacterized protein
MILTCPSCGTRYVVKEGAIPDGGRTVRCAQCKHSWHQDPETESAGEIAESEPVQHVPEHGHVEAAPEPVLDHPLGGGGGTSRMAELGDHAHPGLGAPADDPDAQPLPGPDTRPQASRLAEELPVAPRLAEPAGERDTMPAEAAAASDPYPEEVVPTDENSPPGRTQHPLRAARAEAEDPYSPFAQREDQEEQRPRRRWPLLAALVLLAVVAVALAIWFLAPTEFKNRLGLAQANGETQLLLQVHKESRRSLASGNLLLEVSGTVINPTDETLTVPPLRAQLRSLEQEVVHRWTIPPPAPRLAPGGSASFNSAELNVPADAACLDVVIGTKDEPQAPCKADGAGAGGA